MWSRSAFPHQGESCGAVLDPDHVGVTVRLLVVGIEPAVVEEAILADVPARVLGEVVEVELQQPAEHVEVLSRAGWVVGAVVEPARDTVSSRFSDSSPRGMAATAVERHQQRCMRHCPHQEVLHNVLQALSALLAVARHSVSDWVTAAGYAAYAEALDEEDRAFAASTRARRGERARRRVEAGHE